MKIYCIYDHSGPKYHRIILPAYLMSGVELIVEDAIYEDKLEGVDIVFANRLVPRKTELNIEQLREKYGFKLVIDFDDHWRLDKDHILYDNYEHHGLSDIMELYLEIADAVFVTHERLYNEVLPFNKNCHILPNAIPKFGQFLYRKTEDERVRLFWAGGVTHRKDIEMLRGPAKRINSSKVKWVIGGYSKGPDWKSMVSVFTNQGFTNEVIAALPVDQYYGMYSRCDISLIPLVKSRFNSFKSNLKILEAANIGAPVVVSKVDPYLGMDCNVFYVENQSDWYKHTKMLIHDGNYRYEMGRLLKDYCDRHFNFEKINLERKQIFESLCNKSIGTDLRSTEKFTMTEQQATAIT